MKKKYAPLVIFCCYRTQLLKKLINSLKNNLYSKYTIVYFFVDYNSDLKNRNQIIKILKSVNFFKKKIIIYRKINYGLKKNIYSAINFIFKKFDKIIVLEDDLEVSSNFLKYCNKLLDIYKNDSKIYTISGFSFINPLQISIFKEKYFFTAKRPSSWGWATWRSKWNNLRKEKKYYNIQNLNDNLNLYGNDLILMNLKKKNKSLKSWAFDWTVDHIMQNKFCIYPKHSLIKNHGHDTQSSNNFFKINRKKRTVKISNIKYKGYLEENTFIQNEFKNYYNQNNLMFTLKFIIFKIAYFIKSFRGK